MKEKEKGKSKKKKKNHTLISAVIVTLVLLIGLSLLLYPTAADYINSLDYKKDIETYQHDVMKLDDSTRLEMLDAARAYNAALLQRTSKVGELSPEERREYETMLDPSSTGIMGYIEIEKADIYLPVYHGTEESVLQAGVGHIEGSSLPVGGTGTHCVLSGHTGLPSSKLFSNIDKLEVGDTFELHVLGEVLTYKVESTVVVLPKDAENLEIDADADLCTLITCTPYGVNSHRLLVRGVRTETPPERQPDPEAPFEEIPAIIPPILIVAVAAIPILFAALFIFIVFRRKRHKK